MGLKLFFTCGVYRVALLRWLKYKIMSLPGINKISSWYYTRKKEKEMKGMSRRERYVANKKEESDLDDFCFRSALIRLRAWLEADNVDEEKFQQAKTEVLSSKLINEPEYKNLKEWVKRIDSTEKDYSILEPYTVLA